MLFDILYWVFIVVAASLLGIGAAKNYEGYCHVKNCGG